MKNLGVVWICVMAGVAAAGPLSGFHPTASFDEQKLERWIEPDVRMVVLAPRKLDDTRPVQIIVYATPNGNSIEQTLGCQKSPGMDWHYDIQHVAAQVRKWRENQKTHQVMLACIEAEGLSWPAWRKKHADAPTRANRILDAIKKLAPNSTLTLMGHSGGGSFLWACIEAGEAIRDDVVRIGFLDANYSYETRHEYRLMAWLVAEQSRVLSVIAYDDREIVLNGKKVIGPDGGTYRATQRMLKPRWMSCEPIMTGDFVNHMAMRGQAVFRIHTNPSNKILHTALVGEMNGLLQVMSERRNTSWGTFGGPRAYTEWVQPAPAIPPRLADAPGASALVERIKDLPRVERERVIVGELLRGNMPEFLRKFESIEVSANGHTLKYEVLPDYLAVGSDTDWMRVPLSLPAARQIADAFGCTLPTRKMVDDIHARAIVKLEPIPMTVEREAIATTAEHHRLIEVQRAGRPGLISGIKKDVVETAKLIEKPTKVAIYGWHRLDGKPIQPLNLNHVDWYTDYSHGVRLVRRLATFDGKPRDVHLLRQAADSKKLVDDE